MAKRVTWAALEARLAGRPGWKRRGREYHGPCPVSREGRDTCWFAAGAVDAVRGGCRRCGGRLEGRDLAEHLAALGAREWTAGAGALRSPRPARRPARRLEPAPAVLPAAVWRAAVALKRPGLEYVARRLGCEPIVPAAVRWLPAAAAAAIPPDVEGRRPAVPGGAAGAVVYLFAGAGDSSVAAAVQLEAVDADGRRVPWGRDGVKRWSIPGSDFAGGGRVFVAAPGRPGCGAWVCEGPLDALAVAARVWPFLDGAAVLGVAGVSGFQPAAVGSILGPITLALQGDGDGVASGRVLERRLGRVGRSVRVVRSGLGGDWADPARGGGEGGVTVGEPSSVDRLVHAFDGLSVVDKRRFRRLQAQIDGEGEGAAPSSRGDMVGMLPAGLEPVVTRAMTADGSERLEAARVLAASEPWRRASAAERAIAAWAVSTFDGDAGGYLRAPPGLEHGLQAVLGALDRRSGRWVDPDGTAPAPVEPLEPAAVDWASPAPPRQWLLEGLLPAGRVSALYGPGESGKSRLTLQLALGVVGGADVPVVPVVPMLPGMAAPAKLVIPRGPAAWARPDGDLGR